MIFSGILLAIWGGVLLYRLILIILPMEDSSQTLPGRSLLYNILPSRLEVPFIGFLLISSWLSSFGVWWYKKWARMLTIIVSSLSFLYVSYWFIIGIRVYFLPTFISTRKACDQVEVIQIEYLYHPILLYLFIMACFVYILIIMLNKNTKLILSGQSSDNAIPNSEK